MGRLFDGEIAFSTIYRWIYSGLIDVPVTEFRQKGKRRKPVERRGRFNVGLSISKRPSEVRGVIHAVQVTFPDGTFKTATTDQGKEFSCLERVRASLGVPLYFADPYSSWQCDSNENANGLLRESFPKGSDFATVGQGEVVDALAKINGRPRKCLG